jgi:choline dehydrogenase
MLPAYRRLERDLDYGATDVHGGDGPVPVVRWHDDELVDIQRALAEACGRLGMPWVQDHNRPGTTGIGPFPMNRHEGRRMSTALTYLDAEVRRRPNLELRPHTRVLRIRFAGTRAVGVDVERDGQVETLGAGEVVLSAGAIHSPALLWRSGVGPAATLRRLGIPIVADVAGVGENLHDHPGVFYFVAPGVRRSAPDEPQFQIGARYTSAGSVDTNDMFLSMMNYWDLRGSPDFQAQLGVPAVVVLTCGVHQPRSRGRVSLRSADPDTAPHVWLNMLDDQSDVSRLVDGVRRCAELAADPAMDGFLGASVPAPLHLDDDAALAAYVRAVVAPWYHATGSCSMGPDPAAGAVVADDLGVHGIECLRVVDASVMPTITRAPTNLTTIAIAERAVELFASN